jgi:hypothetical protein
VENPRLGSAGHCGGSAGAVERHAATTLSVSVGRF